MSDTKRAGGARDGRWPPDPEFPSNWLRGSGFKLPLKRIRDRVVSGWFRGTKRENNRLRRAADRVAVREAISEAEAERSIETAEPAEGRAAEGSVMHLGGEERAGGAAAPPAVAHVQVAKSAAGGMAFTVRRDRRSPTRWAVYGPTVYGPTTRRIGTLIPVGSTACWRAVSRDGRFFRRQRGVLSFGAAVGLVVDAALDAVELRARAEQGDAKAQADLGDAYALGLDIQQDARAAVRWYRLAAEQGHAGAQNDLGRMYANGQGVPQDPRAAVRWYRLAADQGYADAQDNLGFMYATGRGVPQDDHKAARWYRLAADQGHAFAQAALERLEAR